MAQTLDNTSILQISHFEKITRANVKDCFEDEFKQLVFCVTEGESSKAVGKAGANIKKLERMFNKKIRVIEFNKDIAKFIENLCRPFKVKKVDYSEQALWDSTRRIVEITPVDLKSRGYLIGKAGVNLRSMESITRRYFEVDEIRVSQVIEK